MSQHKILSLKKYRDGSFLPVPRRLSDRIRPTEKLAVLGSTGSIGTQSLEVACDEGFEVVALAAGGNVEKLAQQIHMFNPASVTPRCSGQSSASERIRYASIIRRGDDALAETTRSVKSSRSNSRTARTADAASASGVTPPYSSTSLLSSEPALTPTRMGTQALRASSTTFIKLSPSRILPGLILILLAPERMAEIAKR
jgi:hypothetical protein